MAYVAGFEYDIFISYSHDDNIHARGKDGWVDIFHEELQAALDRRHGRNKIKIWRDTELNENTVFDEEIALAIKNSAIFLALNSKRYIESRYCQQEYQCFCQHAHTSYGLVLQRQSRLFNVLLRNIPYSKWPAEFQGTKGFSMHDAPENSDRIGEPVLDDGREFASKMRRIVDALDETLATFPKMTVETPAEESKNVSIYLADVADSLFAEKRHLLQQLQSQGIKVVSELPPPFTSSEHGRAVQKAIANSQLSIHMFDQWPGRLIPGEEETTYPRAQFNIGLNSRTSQLVWIPDRVKCEDIVDQSYGEFIKSLETDDRRGDKFELVQKGKTEFLQIVAEKLQNMQAAIKTAAVEESILVDTHQKDQRYAFRLADILASYGLDVEITKESINPVQTLNMLEEYLSYASSLVVLFGNVTPTWVLGRLKKTAESITKQFVTAGKSKFRCCFVFMLPNSTITPDFETLPPFFHIEYLDNRQSSEIHPNIVQPILQTCRGHA
ncbi:toll/interleukin-1 receptor domain-containing protein [candidate division KSB1 bacterium]|nr:toll/interleukin-1 receptor domain-containing protein [candidate division KSB1 bacterium]